jgi:hypothetical protein
MQGKRPLSELPGLPGKALVLLYIATATLPMSAALTSKVEPAGPLSELGTAFALTATALLFLQFLSSGRYKSLSGQIGIDRTMGFNRYRRLCAAVVFSVGIRPCTGAILVLVLTVTQGLFWAGVAATFAMALGTAITVAVLATLALGSRELALKLGGASGRWANAVWTTCTIGGAVVIFLFGAILFAASLGPARPF